MKGLNRIFKIQLFLKFQIFRTGIGWKVWFEQVFPKNVDFRLQINPFVHELIHKMSKNLLLFFALQSVVTSVKKVLEISNLNEDVENLTLYKKGMEVISKFSTVFELWRHKRHMVNLLFQNNSMHERVIQNLQNPIFPQISNFLDRNWMKSMVWANFPEKCGF